MERRVSLVSFPDTSGGAGVGGSSSDPTTSRARLQDFKHQSLIYGRAKDRPYYALFMEQGTGKTRVAIKLAENHLKEGRIQAVLVLTTKGLVRNWSDVELPAHASIPYASDVWPNKRFMGGGSQGETPELNYWLVNIDAILTPSFDKKYREFLDHYPQHMAIVDESTVIKTPSAKRTRKAIELGTKARVRLIMTGLPTPHGPFDLYSQCNFLKVGVLGFTRFLAFKHRYADIVQVSYGQRSFPKIERFKNLDELKENYAKFASVIKKEDCLDLPPISWRVVPVPLTVTQRRHYDQLRKEFITVIKNEVVTAKIVIAMINKALQICSGQIKAANGTYIDIPTKRIEVLEELVEECAGQTIVWTAFVNNATAIGKVFGKEALLLPSGLTLDQRQMILGRFKAGEGKILVANPASAGHGLTLTNSSNMIHFSRSFNYEHRSQADARIHRIGQNNPCLVTDLLDPDTLEKKVVQILTMREEMAEFMMDSKFVRDLLNVKEEAMA